MYSFIIPLLWVYDHLAQYLADSSCLINICWFADKFAEKCPRWFPLESKISKFLRFKSFFPFCVNNRSPLREHDTLSKQPKTQLSTVQQYWSFSSSRSDRSVGLGKQEALCGATGSIWSARTLCLPEKQSQEASFLLAGPPTASSLAYFLRRLTGPDPIRHWLTSSHLFPHTLFQACVVRSGLLIQQIPTAGKLDPLRGPTCWQLSGLIGSGQPLMPMRLRSVGSGVALSESPTIIGQMKCTPLGFPGAQENMH